MVWLGPPLLLAIVFLASHVGAAVDLTLLADLRRTEPHRFYLTCVSGEVGAGRGSDAWGQALVLEKDDRIVRTPRPRQPPQLALNGSQRITLSGFSKPSDLVGVFSCVGGSGARRTSILYVHNSPGAQLLPDKVTHTVNKGDTAVLSARVLKEKQTDVIWKSNGSYFYTLDWHDAQDGRFLLQLPDAQPPLSGIYSATYLEASPLGSAFFRLIVRGCGAGRWGPGCTKECPGCQHGGVCHDQDGECVCPPGFTGTHCEKGKPAERAVLGRAARSSAQVRQAAGASPSASQTRMAVLVDPAGEEASVRKPVPLAILGLTAASSASVRMAALVTASVAVCAPPGGMERTVRSQTGFPRS